MSRNVVLAILLVAQLALVTFICCRSGDKMSAFVSDEKLMNFEVSAIDEIDIKVPDQELLTFKKTAGAWEIATGDGFPVAQKKVEHLLKQLSDLTKGWPVGVTEVAAKEFKTDAVGFAKKLTLKSDGAIKSELYLGTSPALRAVHARVDGDDNTYSIPLNAYELSEKNEDWQDREVLRVEKEKIKTISLNGFSLKKDEKAEGGFVLSDLTTLEKMKKSAVASLLDKITGLRFFKVLGKENKAEYKQDTPIFTFSVTTLDDKKIDYIVSPSIDDKLYIIKSSAVPFYFASAVPPLDALKNLKRADLLDVKKPEEALPTPTPTNAPVPTEVVTSQEVEVADTSTESPSASATAEEVAR